jgi:hypothetical protein
MADTKDARYQAFLAAAGLAGKVAHTPLGRTPPAPAGSMPAPLPKKRRVESPEPESQVAHGRQMMSLAERMAGGLGLPGDSQETPDAAGSGFAGAGLKRHAFNHPRSHACSLHGVWGAVR